MTKRTHEGMSLITRLGQRFLRWLGFYDYAYDRIVLRKEAAIQIIKFARRADPREFSALIEGKVKDKALVLTSVVYQHFESDERTAVIHLNFPISADIRGTVHSHPSRNPLPSRADLRYFNKYSYVNFIICCPYRPQDIHCYDGRGRALPFLIK